MAFILMNQLKEDNYLKTKKSQGSPCDFEKGCLYLIVVLRATTFHIQGKKGEFLKYLNLRLRHFYSSIANLYPERITVG